MQVQTLVTGAIVIFILYRVYLRVRRTVGWQQLNPVKMQIWTAVSIIVGSIFFLEGAIHPIGLISDAAGILLGFVLAYYGSALTRFEQRDGRWRFRPNAWMGSIVTVVFFGRIIYRIYEMYAAGSTGGASATARLASIGYDANSPWTTGLIMIMFAYYVTYYINLLRKRKTLPRSSIG